MFVSPLRPISLIAAMVYSASAIAGPIVSRIVAYEDQVAPGTNGAVFDALSPPSINAKGNIAFKARVFGQGTGSFSDQGIWVERDGVLQLFLFEGDPSPISGEMLSVPGNPNINDAGLDQFGHLAFEASVASSGDDVLWQQRLDNHLDFANNSLRIVAQQNQLAPGTSVNFRQLSFGNTGEHVLTNRLEQVAFFATLDAPSGSNNGIWFDTGSNVRLIARTGDATPGIAGGTFVGIGRPSLNPNGLSAFIASVFVDGRSYSSLWRSSNGASPTLVAIETDASIPPDGTQIRPNGPISVNSGGAIAYSATIYSSQDGNVGGLSVSPGRIGVLRTDRDNVSFNGGDLLLLENGNVVFVGGEAEAPFRQGLYVIDGGAVVPMHVEGDPAPGVPGVTFLRFDHLSANAKGRIGFLADLSDGTEAIYVTALGAGAELVARDGDTIALPSGDVTITRPFLLPIGGTPSNGTDGYRRNISENNDVLWFAATTGPVVIMVTGVGEPPPTPPRLVALEVLQVIQDWNNSVQLIENKRTFVRAHFESNSPMNIEPRLLARRGSDAFTVLRNKPSNPGGRVPIVANASMLRSSRNRVALFELPAAWTTGSIELEIDLDADELICRDPAADTGLDCRASVSFEKVEIPKVQFISPIRLDVAGAALVVDRPAAKDLADRLLSAYPIERVQWGHRIAGVFPADVSLGQVVSFLKLLRVADGCSAAVGCTDFYYGAVRKNSLDGLADGIPSSVSSGFVDVNPRVPGRHTHSHELGHSLGLPHAVRGDRDMDGILDLNAAGQKLGYCGEVAAADAPDFPFVETIAGSLMPTLGPMLQGVNNQIWGYDSLLDRVVDPNMDFPMMSYCASIPIDFWPSRENYRLLRENIDLQFGSLRNLTSQGPVGNYRLIRGDINFDTETVVLQPSLIVPSLAQPDNPVSGDFAARLKNASGGTLSEIAFAAEPYEVRGTPGSQGGFLVAVPDDPEIAQIEILMGGISKTTASASDNAPTVDVLFPDGGENLTSESIVLSWTADDLDKDELTFTVQYSPNNGSSWSTLGADIADETYEIPRLTLAGSDMGLLRVIASDGFNSGSDVSGAVFTVANNAPDLFIESPDNGSLHVSGQVLTLRASGIDTEDAQLDTAGISWTSDLAGPLGDGSPLEIAASSLANGEHVISARVEDSDGAEASTSVRVQISQSAPATLADLRVDWAPDNSVVFADFPVTIPIRVSNLGPDPATGISVDFTSQPGEGIDIESLVAPVGWTCDAASCQTNELLLDQEAVIQVGVFHATPADVSFSANATANEQDPLTGSNLQTLLLEFVELPDAIFSDGFEE